MNKRTQYQPFRKIDTKILGIYISIILLLCSAVKVNLIFVFVGQRHSENQCFRFNRKEGREKKTATGYWSHPSNDLQRECICFFFSLFISFQCLIRMNAIVTEAKENWFNTF